jgi:tetratricopeptide (TPR) repeat protein
MGEPGRLPGKRKQREPFNDRVDILLEELEMAIKWHKPSILLAVYGSELTRIKAETALRKMLLEIGQQVHVVTVNAETFDIPLLVSNSSGISGSVFFISGLRWGGGPEGQNAYRALNLRREYFTKNNTRIVFWLTESEARILPGLSPDFWSFRQRVVEFVEAPIRKHTPSSVIGVTWPYRKANYLPQEIENEITLQEHLLENIPLGNESQAARADHFLALAALWWTKGEFDKSLSFLNRGKTCIQLLQDPSAQARYWVCMGCVLYSLYRSEEALTYYQEAVKLNPRDATAWSYLGSVYRSVARISDAIDACNKAIKLAPGNSLPWINLGDAYRDQGRMEDAIHAYENAIRLNPDDALPWGNLGQVQHMQGRLVEAITAFRKAIDLKTQDAHIFIALAACHRKNGQQKETTSFLDAAWALLEDDNEYDHACFESVAGQAVPAMDFLKKALEKDQSIRIHMSRDPCLDFVRDLPQFRVLLGEA